MKSFSDFVTDQTQGLFVGVRLVEEHAQALFDYCEKNNISNPVSLEKLHMTVLFSKKPCPDFTPLGRFSPGYVASPKKLESWPTREKGVNAIVLTLNCPAAVSRHHELMDNLQATYDYPQYKTHITLSYDQPEDVDVSKLEIPKMDLVFNREYSEPLDPTWK